MYDNVLSNKDYQPTDMPTTGGQGTRLSVAMAATTPTEMHQL